MRGSVVELQGAHTDRCVAFLCERRRHVAGIRAALLPDDDDEEIPLEVKSERRKLALGRDAEDDWKARAAARHGGADGASGPERRLPLDFSLVSLGTRAPSGGAARAPNPTRAGSSPATTRRPSTILNWTARRPSPATSASLHAVVCQSRRRRGAAQDRARAQDGDAGERAPGGAR